MPACTSWQRCEKRPRPNGSRCFADSAAATSAKRSSAKSAGLAHVMQRVDLVSRSEVPVLILGETGTGKELVARAIHNRSERHSGPFLRVNCGAIPRELIDSQLFGHERGASPAPIETRQGWFERADMGTLFLDEIGELPLDAQVRFLRVLQDGYVERVGGAKPIRVNVRVVAATHRDLAAMVRESTFREDLWYRIAVFPILLPPLRDRVGRHSGAGKALCPTGRDSLWLGAGRAERRRHRAAADLRLARQYSRVGSRYRSGGNSGRRRFAGTGRCTGRRRTDQTCVRRSATLDAAAQASVNAASKIATLNDAMRAHIEAGAARDARPRRRTARRGPPAGHQSAHAPRPDAEAENQLVGVSRTARPTIEPEHASLRLDDAAMPRQQRRIHRMDARRDR